MWVFLFSKGGAVAAVFALALFSCFKPRFWKQKSDYDLWFSGLVFLTVWHAGFFVKNLCKESLCTILRVLLFCTHVPQVNGWSVTGSGDSVRAIQLLSSSHLVWNTFLSGSYEIQGSPQRYGLKKQPHGMSSIEKQMHCSRNSWCPRGRSCQLVRPSCSSYFLTTQEFCEPFLKQLAGWHHSPWEHLHHRKGPFIPPIGNQFTISSLVADSSFNNYNHLSPPETPALCPRGVHGE